ncbi:helix-turn-helix domain-containing protein [Aneurinibacillus migulanus]|uniref:DNA-binding transcriptional regulator, XRE-family HTH domain n=1 Tax=Aneurinibacillus migulanus TaxID=47500 RepID=A0A1G8PFE3_ANEMI|nr:helix-turn-helix transcriptional regulator [Aneurinibacillus migulanus]MED0892897.1 helix-turn-helix transcriptional regulator [Aneurinibacillus migulanus]MED1619143.1 helix-turn-helix transcriptional regulator [Aneurinibacillus migulanus]GED14036.1 transcriptional regulator [Aneurinibacillus migulanus]SDI91189.1 DNA-binding transcriptional regulator, XRE-family HTH domain [Aneurinibacillus migulanus]
MIVGENIKKFRKREKMTQNELAKKSKISRSYLADVENGRYNPSIDTLKSIASALNVGISELMGEDNSKHSKDENLDDDYRKIERFARKVNSKDRKKAITILEAAFEDAFEDDEDEDDNL